MLTVEQLELMAKDAQLRSKLPLNMYNEETGTLRLGDISHAIQLQRHLLKRFPTATVEVHGSLFTVLQVKPISGVQQMSITYMILGWLARLEDEAMEDINQMET